MKNKIIQIKNLSKTFGGDAALDDVSLDIFDKEFLVLLGPSGCGKTTLLRLIGGFENPTAGAIKMDGDDITALPPNKRPVNMVFQSYAVFPHLNVRDNIAYGLRIDGVAKDEVARRTDEALALVQLDALAARFSHQLSGGQRQRVALARALVKRPRVLLLDEPLSALDAKLRETMQNELVKLQHTVGITFVVVTHDQDEALSMAERVAVIERGRIRQLDTPRNLYEAPQNRFVADFVGRMNILPARAVGGGRYAVDGLGELAVAGDGGGGDGDGDGGDRAAFVAIRPEKLSVVGGDGDDGGDGADDGGDGAGDGDNGVGVGASGGDDGDNGAGDGDNGAGDGDGGGVGGGDDGDGGGDGTHTVAATIDNLAYYGGQTVLTVNTDTGATLTVAAPNASRNAPAPAAGDRVSVSWRTDDMIALAD